MNVWDIGGQKAIRPYWKNYYDNTDGMVFVVDSSDEERLSECVEELTALLQEEWLEKVPLLVYANKQDLQFALEADEIMNTLQLMQIQKRTWNIQACSALTKEGLSRRFLLQKSEYIYQAQIILQFFSIIIYL